MTETIPTPEKDAEQFPSTDKVLEGFDKFLEGAEITKVLKQVEDENGLFILDVEATLPNGDVVECCYKRARTTESVPRINSPGASSPMEVPSRIQTMVYDSDGTPRTGPQYDYTNGEWVEIK